MAAKYCMKCMNPLVDTMVCPHCGFDGKIDEVPHQLRPGTILNDRYLVGNVLGEGGFGITYIGRDLKLDMRIALKEYYPSGYANRNVQVSSALTIENVDRKQFFADGKNKFLREARVLARFSEEPGVVGVHDFFEANETAYIVMEYLEGLTLKDYLKSHDPFPPEEILKRFIPLLKTLEKIHERDVIHRDISPDNIMLMKNGSLKLMDFGAARTVGLEEQKSLSIMLKPGFAPEEQYRTRGEQGPWTDVYAICATLYKCITGITPDDAMQRLYEDELKLPSELGIEITPNQEKALMAGLAVKQKQRCHDIKEFLRLLGGGAAEDTVQSLELNVSTSEEKAKAITEAEDKTVYMEMPEEDKTVYMKTSEAEDKTVYMETSEAEDRTVYMEPAKAPEQPQQAPQQSQPPRSFGNPQPPQQTTQQPQSFGNSQPQQAPQQPQPPQSFGNHPQQSPQPPRQPKKHGKAGLIITLSALAVILCVAAGFILIRSGLIKQTKQIAIAGETYYCDKDTLSFYSKELTGEDILILNQFPNLKYLYFKECTFSVDALDQLASMENMKNLKGFNMEKCAGPKSYEFLASMTKLRSLTIQECGFSGITNKLSLMDLNELNLSKNKDLKDIAFLSECTGLMHVNISETAVEDISSLNGCKQMNDMNCNGTSLTNLDTMANYSELIILEVSDCKLTDEGIKAIINCKKLMSFSADRNQIADISPILGLENLRILSLRGNKIAKDVWNGKVLSSLRLEKLYLGGNAISSIGFLSGLTKLIEIDLSDCSNTQAFADLFARNPGIVYCDVSRDKLTSLQFLSGCTKMKELHADENGLVELNVLKGMSDLQVLSVNSNQIGDISGLKNHSKLKYLDLGANNVSDLSPIDSLADKASLNLCANAITDIQPLAQIGCTYNCILLYFNRLQDSSPFALMKGNNLGLTYQDTFKPEDLNNFNGVYISPVPLSSRVKYEDVLGTIKCKFGMVTLSGEFLED